MTMLRFLTALAVISTCGCLRPDPVTNFTPAWDPFDGTEEGWERTREILLIADCQLHNLYSKPVPDRNLSAEAAVATAIRSPQLDLFSEDVLAWITKNGAPGAELILHLGDALDLACEGEFERFVDVMEAAGRPWFMLPGNHDAYYFGVYDPEHPELWDDACNGAGRRLSKDLFIRLYLGAMLRQTDAGIDALAESLGLGEQRSLRPAQLAEGLPLEYEWEAGPEVPGLLDSVAWKIDIERPWRSFLLQRLDVSREGSEGLKSRVLLMDTCQYMRRPAMIPNGWMSYPVALNSGSAGQMLPDQLRKVREWLEQDSEWVHTLMGHHPFGYLAPHSKSSLGFLWREARIALMVTAHTHTGFYEHHDLGGDEDALELNIASTTDWPMEWRTLSGFKNDREGTSYLLSERHSLVQELSHKEGYFLQEWEVPPGAEDDYRRYKQGSSDKLFFLDYYYAFHLAPYWLPQPRVRAGRAARETEAAVKSTLLSTHARLLREFPTDMQAPGTAWPAGCSSDDEVIARIGDMMALEDGFDERVAYLIELAEFERTRSSADPESGRSTDEERTRFKISQAAWASRYERSRGRRLSVEDELIRMGGWK